MKKFNYLIEGKYNVLEFLGFLAVAFLLSFHINKFQKTEGEK